MSDDIDVSSEDFFRETPIPPDATWPIQKVVEDELGLNFEYHNVTTEDGYILEMHRVFSANFTAEIDRPVVFCQHGVLSSSEGWIARKEEGAAYIFANAGYDVWLGNNRGNHFSRKHATLDPKKDKAKFFDYSFYEMA